MSSHSISEAIGSLLKPYTSNQITHTITRPIFQMVKVFILKEDRFLWVCACWNKHLHSKNTSPSHSPSSYSFFFILCSLLLVFISLFITCLLFTEVKTLGPCLLYLTAYYKHLEKSLTHMGYSTIFVLLFLYAELIFLWLHNDAFPYNFIPLQVWYNIYSENIEKM